MAIGYELPLFRQSPQGFSLPRTLIATDVFEDFRLQDEETAVDPAPIALRLLQELGHVVTVQIERTEAPRRLHGCQRRVALGPFVELDQLLDVDVRDAVSIRKAEPIAIDVLSNRVAAARPCPSRRRCPPV